MPFQAAIGARDGGDAVVEALLEALVEALADHDRQVDAALKGLVENQLEEAGGQAGRTDALDGTGQPETHEPCCNRLPGTGDGPGSVLGPLGAKRLQAVERWTRHLTRKLEALDRKLAGLDQHVSGLLRDARQRLRRLERLLGK
jgi:hypothetical protein